MEPKTVRRAGGDVVPLRHFSRDDMPNALLAGTRVLTLEGEMPVEYLSPGDRIITRDRGMVTLDDLRIMRGKVPVITIRAGSLGHMRPEADADLPASQEVLIRDWRAQALYGRARAMVPAERLVDGEFIRPSGLREVTLVALVFSEPHVIYAEGLELAAAVRETSAA